ncbi:LysR family transcriptional regulator [Streptomonospora litoralis]|uniref:HTH-type transcriptional regulator CynR n=1 Tax=Streptomonospora litoralis TaxID=2498135 RepID=A0A4P6Q0N1_9ACTN|nr:LysR family transcriptional regulator [Streptomonospora litoralis]QBI53630.1 HTH-type transcriptional regulator CynR [Streptomonospora litoralis]
MERKHLEYFLSIASHGSFTSASNSLRIAQPSLSYAIRVLEREVGAPLFRRVGRGVVLTPVGEALLDPARQVLHDFMRVQTAAQRVSGLVSGRIDIAAVTTLAVDPLASFVGAFRNLHPGVEFRIVDAENAASIVDLVRRGQCEVGLTEHGIPAAGMRVLDLPQQEVLAVLPPSTAEPEGPLPLQRIAELDLVTTPNGTTTRSALDSALAVTGTSPRIAVETTHRAAIVPLVIAGAGATLLPYRLAMEAAGLGAVVVGLAPPLARRGVLVWPPEPLSPAAQAFIDLVSQRSPDDGAQGPGPLDGAHPG